MSHAVGPLSRSRISLRNSQLMISSELKLVPMWPDQAPAIMYSVLMRASAANARGPRRRDAVRVEHARELARPARNCSSSDSPWSVCRSPMVDLVSSVSVRST